MTRDEACDTLVRYVKKITRSNIDDIRIVTMKIGHKNLRMHCPKQMFVLLKIYRIPKENPLVWQLGLIDSEINDVLRGSFSVRMRSCRTNSFAVMICPNLLSPFECCACQSHNSVIN